MVLESNQRLTEQRDQFMSTESIALDMLNYIIVLELRGALVYDSVIAICD